MRNVSSGANLRFDAAVQPIDRGNGATLTARDLTTGESKLLPKTDQAFLWRELLQYELERDLITQHRCT